MSNLNTQFLLENLLFLNLYQRINYKNYDHFTIRFYHICKTVIHINTHLNQYQKFDDTTINRIF